MTKDRTRHVRRRESQPERTYASLSELAFWAKITASAMERVHGPIADTTQCLKEIRKGMK